MSGEEYPENYPRCDVCGEPFVYSGKHGRLCAEHARAKGLIRKDISMIVTRPTKKYPLGKIKIISLEQLK